MLFSRLALAVAVAPAVQAVLQYRAMDWSSLLIEEERNSVYYQNATGQNEALEGILVDNGVNMVRQRVWTNAGDGDYGIDYNIRLAKRAEAAGLMFGLNLHYSDTWTNPGLQDIPTGWPTDVTGLAKKVWDHTTDVCNAFAAASLIPETITIGNEINGGILWPTGKYDQPANLAKLLQTASQAIRASNLKPQPKIQIHLSHGEEGEEMQWWYDMVLSNGLTLEDFDMQTVSFYPFWGSAATQANLTASLGNMATRYGKELMVVETNWPIICSKPDYAFPSDTVDIPIGPPAGQTTWIQRTAASIASVPKGVGLSYWEGGWVSNAVLGSSCEWNAMFDGNGRAYDSIGVFNTI
ncbi:arabinogalactan endo-1,4-beta-galactosidase [Boeremia exigua]|uniref:arabinogalactan endo-1,4-beta-galactosidase n=1 Tax=Boeremia exigua TaxID=749465 RepID=UPI001E8D9DE4|nr:arabinogalactan endo-1,4-beta-galactosidase [Boeremia exigua]KAH6639114.1 arabinogalactan endo-1,4-beta-galactosidase [Boeremia exigua]